LWWAVYDNEPIDEEDPTKADEFRGFGIYDQVNDRPRVLHGEFETYYTWHNDYLELFKRKKRRLPNTKENLEAIIQQLDRQILRLKKV
jgi:hypothetical protein